MPGGFQTGEAFADEELSIRREVGELLDLSAGPLDDDALHRLVRLDSESQQPLIAGLESVSAGQLAAERQVAVESVTTAYGVARGCADQPQCQPVPASGPILQEPNVLIQSARTRSLRPSRFQSSVARLRPMRRR